MGSTRHGRSVSAAKAGWNLARTTAARWVGDRPKPTPWNSRIVDDIADGRPWNLVVKALRMAAQARMGSLRTGPTIVIVNWNTGWMLRRLIPQVMARTPAGTPIYVVDNGSDDGSIDYLKKAGPDVRTLGLPVNVGHGPALDIATLTAGTDIVVVLDSDAFPISNRWLDAVVEPVMSGKAAAAGLRATRGFVHPSFMALDVPTFVRERLSFQVHRMATGEGQWGVERWDTGELLSRRLGEDRLAFLEVVRGERGLPGVTAGGVVYHHGAMSRQPNGQTTLDAVEGFDRALGVLGAEQTGSEMKNGTDIYVP